MVIQEINQNEVIMLGRAMIGLPVAEGSKIDDIFISCSLRRLAGFMCPCSVSQLKTELLDSLIGLVEIDQNLDERIESLIDKLVIGGDLVELNRSLAKDAPSVNLLYLVSPSFTIRPNGNILLIGVVADEVSPHGELTSRIHYEGSRRIVKPRESEDLVHTLLEMGLTHINEKTWLKLPEHTQAGTYLNELNRRLANSSLSSDLDGITIIDSDQNVNYYRHRWNTAQNYTGKFVARRPQAYGAPIWCYVDLVAGRVTRFIDMPSGHRDFHQRGCDAAWQLQMAIDFMREKPQEFRVRTENNRKIFDFFSPIPLWAERRLIAIGTSYDSDQSLFSYAIDDTEFRDTVEFLSSFLWLKSK